MGDGRVALILDVMGIAQKCGEVAGSHERTRVEAETRQEHAADSRQTFLLFRAGPFERLAVPLSLVARLEEFPLSRVERAGNHLVVQYRGRILPLAPLASILEPGSIDTASTQDPVQVIVFNDGDRRIGLLVDQLVDIVDDTVTIRQATGRKGGRRGLLGSAVIGKRVTDILDLDAVIRDASSEWEQETGAAGSATVMLAEGSPFSRGILRASLEMAGYRVVEASTAAEALNQLARVKVNVVVTALDLPGGGGYEFLEKMRREPSLAGVPALALSDSAGDAAGHAAQPGAFHDYLIRGDREAMLRSIHRLASALNAKPAAPELVGEKG
jgi:two-component system chemotaxis sensor kinase CheA